MSDEIGLTGEDFRNAILLRKAVAEAEMKRLWAESRARLLPDVDASRTEQQRIDDAPAKHTKG